MPSRDSRPRKKRRGLLATLVLGLAALLAWLLNSVFGLGPGSLDLGDLKELGELVDREPRDEPPDARPEPPADAAGPTRCLLELGSEGLTLNGETASIDDAVRVCRAVGRAELRATGGARAGTYRELVRALRQAGVPIKEQSRPTGR